MPTIMFVIVWKELGFGVVLCLARLMSVSEEYFESARVDGARLVAILWHVTVPQLAPALAFYAVVELINMLSWVFAYIYVMTLGGPQNSTVVSEYYIYQQVFTNNIDRRRLGRRRGAARHRLRADRAAGLGAGGGSATYGLRLATATAGTLARAAPLGALSRHALLLGFSALALLPIYFMLVNAFKTNAEYIGNRSALPHEPVALELLDGARAAASSIAGCSNSVLVTLASVGLSTALAALAAYPLSLMRWRAGPFVLRRPDRAAGGAADRAGHPDLRARGRPASSSTPSVRVIVIYTGIMLPFSTFLLASFFATISRPLLEAARIDGAGTWRAFWEIVLPLSVPALMTVVIVQSLWVWNEVLIAVIFLQDQGLRTLMVGLTLFNSRYRHDVPVVMAGMLCAAVPMVVLYLLGQRFFIRGLTAGGVKG